MANNIVKLRDILFDQLQRLVDAPLENVNDEVTRAASVVQVSETIIKSAQVENDFISITKSNGSGFLPVTNKPKELQ